MKTETTNRVALILLRVFLVPLVLLDLLLLIGVILPSDTEGRGAAAVFLVFLVAATIFLIIGERRLAHGHPLIKPRAPRAMYQQTQPVLTRDMSVAQPREFRSVPDGRHIYWDDLMTEDSNRGTLYVMEDLKPAVRRIVAQATGFNFGTVRATATMRLEPENAYDEDAVAVYVEDMKIGYLYEDAQTEALDVLRNDPDYCCLDIIIRVVPDGLWVWFFDSEKSLVRWTQYLARRDMEAGQSYPTSGIPKRV